MDVYYVPGLTQDWYKMNTDGEITLYCVLYRLALDVAIWKVINPHKKTVTQCKM